MGTRTRWWQRFRRPERAGKSSRDAELMVPVEKLREGEEMVKDTDGGPLAEPGDPLEPPPVPPLPGHRPSQDLYPQVHQSDVEATRRDPVDQRLTELLDQRLDARVTGLGKHLNNVMEQVAGHTVRMEALEKKVDKLSEEAVAHLNMGLRQHDRLKSQASAIERLEQQLQDHAGGVTHAAAPDDLMSELQEKVAEIGRSIADHRMRLNELDDRLDELQDRLPAEVQATADAGTERPRVRQQHGMGPRVRPAIANMQPGPPIPPGPPVPTEPEPPTDQRALPYDLVLAELADYQDQLEVIGNDRAKWHKVQGERLHVDQAITLIKELREAGGDLKWPTAAEEEDDG